VLPVDVLQSGWTSTLQWSEQGRRRVLAVRLGIGTVRGIGASSEEGVRVGLDSVGERGPFVDPEDFARRTGLGRAVMENLARLGALGGFESLRRQALWRVAQMARKVPGPLAEPLPGEADVQLPTMSAGEIIREDYAMGGLSVERHPIELLRAELDRAGVVSASALRGTGADVRPGRRVAVAGMVICRQRPGTARGLTFVTLEDETGFANLVVFPDVAQAHPAGLKACLMLAQGRIEAADGVVNVRADTLISLDGGRPVEGFRSHDYR
jgi:error-prone DNA polymerase